jgi:hypothetical protein
LTYHSNPAEIAELTHGALSRAARQRLVAHLLRGCPSCSRLLAPGLALMQAAPAALEPSVRRAQPALPGGDPVDPYELPVARACAAAVRRMRGQLPVQRGRRAGPAPVSDAPGQRGPLRVERLLAASWELRHNDAGEMVRLAELALFAAERLSPAHYGREAIADILARVWAELANAHRVAAELPEADQAMARAVGWQHRGSGDPWLLARIADLMASLLADQRRLAEAGDLLSILHRFYHRNGERHLAGRALISRGIFAGYDNDSRAALAFLTEGLESIDPQADEQLAAQAVQAIVWNLVNCGRFRQARIHLWRSRPLLVRHGGKLHFLRVRWLAGRIHAGLRDFGRAEGELAAARSGFEAAGNPYNAALASLDLAAVWLQQGKTQQVRQLVEEMIAVFRALRIGREAMAALLILREACDRDAASLDQLRSVELLLSEIERQPRRRAVEGSAD